MTEEGKDVLQDLNKKRGHFYQISGSTAFALHVSFHPYHESPGYIAAQSPSSQEKTLGGDHLVQVQGRNQPPSHQLQIQIGHGQADDVEVPHSVEALLSLHGVEDEQVHHDREERNEPQTDPQHGVVEAVVEVQRVIAPQRVVIEEATPAAVAVIDEAVGVEV
ncbi:hypothetical protein EYF80_007512 [Liparis tanakae]|uniref:Uncharacterized protein n=1 Tax=Liparis tanakae TaxID=230148 RepID=A0A4Z2IX74_9TELE|nr:hypothetical protein EYF80_007512 [Liparis tanakae]